MTVQLCKQFPAYTPTGIRKTQAHEVFMLIKRVTKYNNRENNNQLPSPSANKRIRVAAGDTWF
nr:MAG TPA: hypothetical protein [Caudoviricetes sp.]